MEPEDLIDAWRGMLAGVGGAWVLFENGTCVTLAGPGDDGESGVIKSDIINNVARIADITRVRAVVAVEAILDAMKESMRKGERIELRGFGVFQVKPRKKGIGRNPRTGTQVAIPEGKTIRFKPGKELQS